ncbi:MAG: hypothetical protein HQ522_15905 [Bacteroidetes bacterium]|nr:hypothetical protein [Bacteroidota bacterium]
MKRLLLVVAVIVASYSFSNAQEIGIRFGDVSAGNVETDLCLIFDIELVTKKCL